MLMRNENEVEQRKQINHMLWLVKIFIATSLFMFYNQPLPFTISLLATISPLFQIMIITMLPLSRFWPHPFIASPLLDTPKCPTAILINPPRHKQTLAIIVNTVDLAMVQRPAPSFLLLLTFAIVIVTVFSQQPNNPPRQPSPTKTQLTSSLSPTKPNGVHPTPTPTSTVTPGWSDTEHFYNCIVVSMPCWNRSSLENILASNISQHESICFLSSSV